jgi:hypothetical protein
VLLLGNLYAGVLTVQTLTLLFETTDIGFDLDFLGCGIVWAFRWIPAFRRNILPPSSWQISEDGD